MDNKSIVVPDKERTPYIRQAFELYATGRYSLSQIVNKLYEDGLRSKTGNKVYKAKIHTILRNPFYYGVMRQQGEDFQGNHDPIIPKSVFDKCQQVTQGVSKPRNKKHKFLLRGLCKCAECGCSITAENQRSNYYYRCTGGRGNCEQKRKYLREEKVENQIAESIFNHITFNQKFVNSMYKSMLERADFDNG